MSFCEYNFNVTTSTSKAYDIRAIFCTYRTIPFTMPRNKIIRFVHFLTYDTCFIYFLSWSHRMMSFSTALKRSKPMASSEAHRRWACVGQVVLANQRGRPRHRGLLATGDQTQGPGLAGRLESKWLTYASCMTCDIFDFKVLGDDSWRTNCNLQYLTVKSYQILNGKLQMFKVVQMVFFLIWK